MALYWPSSSTVASTLTQPIVGTEAGRPELVSTRLNSVFTMSHTRTSSKAHLDQRRSAPASEAVEDYAKAIYALQRARRAGRSRPRRSPSGWGSRPSSVTAMLKRLDELGLVRYEPYHGVSLTPAGERVALEVIRHHRLIESFLAEALADALGPGSRRGRGARALHLGGARGADRRQRSATRRSTPTATRSPTAELDLADGPDGRARRARAGTQARRSPGSPTRDPAMLRYLAERGIRPGPRLRVKAREPFGGPLSVEVDGREHALGGELADKMRVEAGGDGA